MKKIIILLVLFSGITLAQPSRAQLTLFPYSTSVVTTNLWSYVQPSGGSTIGTLDTTKFYRTGIIDPGNYDSLQLFVVSSDTICAKIWLWHTDGATFADSTTSVLDSVKFNGAGSNYISWRQIKAALGATATGENVNEPFKIRFTLTFYTSVASGSPHTAHSTRAKTFKMYVKYHK